MKWQKQFKADAPFSEGWYEAKTPCLAMRAVPTDEPEIWFWSISYVNTIFSGTAPNADAAREAAEAAYREFLRREFSALTTSDRRFVAGEGGV